MKMSTNDISRNLQEALFALSMERSVPDATILDSVVQQYPEFATELTDFATYLVISEMLGKSQTDAVPEEVDQKSVSPMVSRAISRMNNRLHELQASDAAAEETSKGQSAINRTENPFSNLSRAEIRAFSKKINANGIFVIKLRDRQIVPDTISDGFKELVARELNEPLSVVGGHFAAANDSFGQVRQFYKSVDKPVLDQQESFEDAVQNSGLSEEQQAWLLSL